MLPSTSVTLPATRNLPHVSVAALALMLTLPSCVGCGSGSLDADARKYAQMEAEAATLANQSFAHMAKGNLMNQMDASINGLEIIAEMKKIKKKYNEADFMKAVEKAKASMQ
jgi:hypothetical protein